MKRVVIAAPGTLDPIEEAEPVPAAGEALIEVLQIGVCGSDLHTLAGHHPFVTYPVLPGHEVVGRVRTLGPGGDATLLGRTVVLEPSLASGAVAAERMVAHTFPLTEAAAAFDQAGERGDTLKVVLRP